MITKESFVKVINLILSHDKFINQANSMGLISCECQINLDFDNIITILFEEWFDDQGIDWIYWWLYDKPLHGNRNYNAWDADGSPIDTETIDDLWNIVKEHILTKTN